MVEGQKPHLFQFQPGSPQVVELRIVLEVFKSIPLAFNLISDSQYMVNAISHLEATETIKESSTVCEILREVQSLIWCRSGKFFAQHIRAHTGLPGPLSNGNKVMDQCTRMECVFLASSLDQVRRFHQQYHVPARTLQLKFHLSRADALQIVLECQNCVAFYHPP